MTGRLIAATHSGAGKTTATGVVLRALTDRGLSVQAFKHGPDFIDPGYHREITGTPSINLDLELMDADGIRDSFARWSAGADVSIVESMGALYDGTDGTERGSPAALAKLLDLPVLLIIDVWGMTRTAAAILDGMINFDPDVRIEGCILNRVGSAGHAQMIMDSLPERLRRLVIGHIVHQPDLEVEERHLGLLTVEENPTATTRRATAQRSAGRELDLSSLLPAVTPRRPATRTPSVGMREPTARLGIARDAAFCFSYEENLATLQQAGFELVPFSPIDDPQLPADLDAIWLGGGYPESFAAALAGNVALADDLRKAANAGVPIHAECGGMLYLARSLTGFDGVRHPMVGLLPIDVIMDRGFLAIGYATGHTLHPSALGPPGTAVRGQQFHQSRIESADLTPNLFRVTDTTGATTTVGYRLGSVTASYLHLHFARTPAIAPALHRAAVSGQSRSG